MSKLSVVDIEFIKDITDEIKKLKTINQEIDNKLCSLKNAQINHQKQIDYAKLVLDLFDTYFQSFNKYDLMTKRALMRLIIKSITCKNEEITINLVGADDNNPSEKILYLPELHSKSSVYGKQFFCYHACFMR